MIPGAARASAPTHWCTAFSLLVLLAACGGSDTGQKGSTGSTSSHSVVTDGDGAAWPLVIATDRGIEEIDMTGKVIRRISPTPARRPRLTGDGQVIFMARGFAELRRVKLDGTGERPLALIPPTVAGECDTVFPTPWDPALLLRSDRAMQLDTDAKAVCLHLTAGEGDSSSAWVRVDLPESGRGRGTLGLVCGVEPPPTDFQCSTKNSKRQSKPAGKYEVRARAIVEKGTDRPARELATGELSEVAWSSSSPWSLVVAAVKKGKFIHRSILALNRDSGQIYPIEPGRWPKPISDKRWRALGQGKEISRAVALQSDIRALDRDGLFIVDTLLIVPGQRVVDARGHFAQ